MTKRQVSFSDLSGQMAPSDGDLIPLIVTDYPDSDPDQRKRIEVTPAEMEDLGKIAIAAVGLETEPTNDERRARFVVPLAKLAKLATVAPLDQVLADAELVSPPPRARSSSGGNGDRRSHNRDKDGNPLTDYSAPENAGLPHNGKIGKRERDYVHANLDEVNARRAAAGHPAIDPTNPVDAERYGFPSPGEQPNEQGTTPAQDA
jgi:hypothetical protein